ncbi:MAG: OmpW family outer membrane protein [Caulobacteraceae bacterium]|nr:OmpW family outer membrane protein [Caulobacteraceae bacterium]
MKTKYMIAAAAAAFSLVGPAHAHADDTAPLSKGTWLITGRVTDVFSNASNAITNGAGAPSGLHVNVGSSVMPTLGITYFLTDHISAEAILGVTDHHIKAEGAGVSLPVYDTWVLPPVITLQYRPLTHAPVSPYVGAGVNAMIFFSGSNKSGFSTHLSDAVGWALQAGLDAPVSSGWTLNADVKKVFVTTKAKVDTGSGYLYSNVHLDPWILSLGVGHRF